MKIRQNPQILAENHADFDKKPCDFKKTQFLKTTDFAVFFRSKSADFTENHISLAKRKTTCLER